MCFSGLEWEGEFGEGGAQFRTSRPGVVMIQGAVPPQVPGGERVTDVLGLGEEVDLKELLHPLS